MTSQIGRLSPRQRLTAAALLLAIAGCSCADRASSDESPARDGEHGGEQASGRRYGHLEADRATVAVAMRADGPGRFVVTRPIPGRRAAGRAIRPSPT